MFPTPRQRSFAGFDPPPPLQAAAEAPSAQPLPLPAEPAARDDNPAGRRVFVIDSHSLIYQVFHGMPEMTSPEGQPVAAVHGFIRDILDLIEFHGADFLFAAFDHPGPNFRHALYDQYKIHRDEMPGDLQLQIPLIQQFLVALRVPVLSVAGFEADDILATVAREVAAQQGECLLVTSDKDCRQLITDRVKLFNIRKNEIVDAEKLRAIWGVRPDQVVDFQTLVGDATDNIPGVPQIGPKNAQELLQKYETLEGIFSHAQEISGPKRRENIIQGQKQALLSRQLVKLDDQVPLHVDWPLGRVGQFDLEATRELCQRCGFRQLSSRLTKLAGKLGGGSAEATTAQPERSSEGAEVGETLISEAAAGGSMADEAPWIANYQAVTSLAALKQLVAEMTQVGRVVIDTETTSLRPRQAEIVGYSFCFREGEAYYVPVKTPPGEPCLDHVAAREILRPALENPALEKLGQNIKYDMVVLRSAGVDLRGATFDTMVADYLLDPGERTHNLDDLARRHLRHTNITIESLIGAGKRQKRMDEVPVAAITAYAAEDADVPLRLAQMLTPRLHEKGLWPLFAELEMPLIEVLAELEYNGVRVDAARLRELGSQFSQRIAELEAEIYAAAGGPFNIDSRLQLSKLLFETLHLPVLKKTKTGKSTDAEVLDDLAKLHPLPAKILEYRQNAKLKSTYVDALLELIHPETGRVHSSFKQDVAATGRLSSQDPNLQNIPVRTEQGRAIRSAFLPGPTGWRLMTADYSQIELRVLAHFSHDATLTAAFENDLDVHAQVAGEVYGVPLAEVTKEMRRAAKAINFGVIYGQSPFGLAKALDISQADAEKFIAAYFAKYPGVDRFMSETLRTCRGQGFVSTILGRRRPVQGVRDPDLQGDKRQRTLPERIAINTVIQGSAADIIKRAMIGVYRRLKREGLQAKLLLQIHDELVLEFPPAEQDRLATLVGEEMAGAAQLTVPLKIDVKTGANWAECEPL